jgi:hypothetical protein
MKDKNKIKLSTSIDIKKIIIGRENNKQLAKSLEPQESVFNRNDFSMLLSQKSTETKFANILLSA